MAETMEPTEAAFKGLKARLAMELSGFTGDPNVFKNLIPVRQLTGRGHRSYEAQDIRKIRAQIHGIDLTSPRARQLPPIVNCCMSKGGTGKTTIAANLACVFALCGLKVLIIDGDAQASLTSLFGIDWTAEEITHVGDLMQRVRKGEPARMREAIRPIYAGGMLDLIPSDLTLSNADSWMMGAPNREALFKRLLDSELDFLSEYDVIVIDSAPGTTLLTTALRYACKTLLGVVLLDGHCMKAMTVLASNVQEINDAYKGIVDINIHLVANGWHASYQTCRDALQTLQDQYPDFLDDNVIPQSSEFLRQMSLYENTPSGPVIERAPNSLATRAIIDLARSLIRLYDIRLAGVKL